MSERLLRLPKVVDRTGLSKPSIYRLIQTGDFPKPRRVGKRAVAWLDSEISEFINSLEVAV